MLKTIELKLEDMSLNLMSSTDSLLVDVKLTNEFRHTLEVTPSIEEVKEIIKALQQILPKEEGERIED